MKLRTCLIPAAALALGTAPLPAASFVYETESEFVALPDLDANGVADVLIIDKASGQYRVGYTAAGGAITWAGARPGGVAPVTGAAFGKLNGTATGFAVTGPEANRFNILFPSTTGYTEPRSELALGGVAPMALCALDIPGAGATAEDDLAVLSTANPGTLTELRQIRVSAGALSALHTRDTLDGAMLRANPYEPAVGAAPLIGSFQAGDPSDTFRTWQLDGSGSTLLFSVSRPSGSSWLPVNFEAAATDLVFYRTGTASIHFRRISGGPGTWAVNAGTSVNLGFSVQQIAPVNTPGGKRLLVLKTDGTLVTYSYTLAGGLGAAVAVPLTPSAGVASGLLPLSGNAFHLLYSPAAGQPVSLLVPFTHNGTSWVQGAASALPAFNPLSSSANLFVLSSPLFRTPAPDVTRTYRTRDWSTSVTVGAAAPFTVTAQAASFGTATTGLGAASALTAGNLGAAAPATAVNQLNAAFSLFTYDNTLGPTVDSVTISPAAGDYNRAIRIQFTDAAGSSVFYRTSASAGFQAWSAGAAPWLWQNATVEYYVRAGTVVSPVRSATYTFSRLPARQDQDGDLVPDFVEIARGLDPAAGSDSDGDGFGDLAELRAGTDPALSSSKPAAEPASASSPLIRVIPQHRQANGAADGTVLAGTTVTVENAGGSILGQGSVGAGGAADFALRDLSPESGFAVVRTPAHFVVTPLLPGSPPRGAEMLALVPALPAEGWNYGTSGGAATVTEAWSWGGTNFKEGGTSRLTAPTESSAPQFINPAWDALQDDPAWGASPSGARSAAAWITEMQAASSTTARPWITVTVTPESTLRALLMEEEGIFYYFMLLPGEPTQRFSLTPDRAANAAERRFGETHAAALRQADPANLAAPRYRALDVLRHLDGLSIATKTRAEQIAREIYRVIPAGTSLAPLDALRSYIRTGVIPQPYRAGVSFTNAQITATWNQLVTLRSASPVRPLQSLTMTRTAADAAGIGLLTLTDPANGTRYSLITGTGAPALDAFYTLPEVGDEVLVSFYSDTPDISGFPSIEVLSCKWEMSEFDAVVDSDGDLLGDDWEMYYFGTLAFSGTDQRDGSAYSLMQEYFDSTNPEDASSSPASPAALMRLSGLRLAVSGPGQLTTSVNWPAAYARFVDVRFLASSSLQGFAELPAVPSESPVGTFNLPVNPSAAPRQFFLPVVRLKP